MGRTLQSDLAMNTGPSLVGRKIFLGLTIWSLYCPSLVKVKLYRCQVAVQEAVV